MKKVILLFAMMLAGTHTVFSAETLTSKLYATFGSLPGGANAKLGLYSWKATTNNLVQLYTFSNGELANYTTLKFTLGDKDSEDGMIRVGYKVSGSDTFNEFGNGYGSNGDKSVDLSDITDKTTVTEISFGGRSGTGTVTVYNVYLTNDNGDKLYPTYGTVGGNATFYDYSWTNTNNNLWSCFEVTAGVLDNYSALKFTLSNAAPESGAVRMMYKVNSDSDTEFGSGYSTLSGTKSVDISEIANITKISFGGRNNGSGSPITGSVNLRDVYVSNEFDVTSTTAWTWSTDVPNNTISYNREFTEGQASTICLPFALSSTEVTATGGKFYEFESATSTSLKFSEVSETTAYTPYLFVAGTNTTPFSSLTNKEIVASEGANTTVTKNGFSFIGTLAKTDIPTGAYGFNGGDLKKAGTGVTINAFRGYFTGAFSESRSIDIDLGDGSVTGISKIQAETSNDTPIYNLNGQRVGTDYKGIVIQNGKKVIKK